MLHKDFSKKILNMHKHLLSHFFLQNWYFQWFQIIYLRTVVSTNLRFALKLSSL